MPSLAGTRPSLLHGTPITNRGDRKVRRKGIVGNKLMELISDWCYAKAQVTRFTVFWLLCLSPHLIDHVIDLIKVITPFIYCLFVLIRIHRENLNPQYMQHLSNKRNRLRVLYRFLLSTRYIPLKNEGSKTKFPHPMKVLTLEMKESVE